MPRHTVYRERNGGRIKQKDNLHELPHKENVNSRTNIDSPLMSAPAWKLAARTYITL